MSQENLDERIAHRAYQIWLQEGRPDGKSEEHWFQAKCEIEGGSLCESVVMTHCSEGEEASASKVKAAKKAAPRAAAKTDSSATASKATPKSKTAKGK